MTEAGDTPRPATAPLQDQADDAIKASPALAGRSRRAWVRLIVITLIALGVDLGTKAWAFESIADEPVHLTRANVLAADHLGELLPAHRPVVVVPGVLDLKLVLNPGAVFGLGAGARWFFIAFTGVAVVFLLWMFARLSRPGDRLAHAAIGLLIAGGLGNLYDRLSFACVRDFLHPLPQAVIPWTDRAVWPYVSNVADAYLIVGIVGLVVLSVRKPHTAES